MDNPTILFSAGALLIVLVMMRRSRMRGRLAKLPSVSPPPHKAHPPAGHHLDAPGAMGRWEVEMHELARDLAGQLDSKIVIVERLVQDAEQATARLEAAIHRAEQVGLWQRSSGQLDDETVAEPLAESSAFDAPSAKPVRDWPNPAEPDVPQPDPTGAAATTAALVNRTERVYRLADRGLSGPAIAAELGEPLGEVELILSVRSGEKAH